MIKDLIKNILEPICNIKNKKYLNTYYKEMQFNKEHFNFDSDKLSKVLVLAPHQDDESIGMGGTIAKLCDQGSKVDVVYLTDGRMNEEDIETSKTRIKEAKIMKDIYGVSRIETIDNINLTLSEKENYTVETIENLLELKEYDAVFVTGAFDCHVDHRAAFDILVSMIKKNSFKEEIIFYIYDINNSIQGRLLNCYSLIEKKYLDKKWKSYDVFKSQKYITFSTLKIMDLQRINIGFKGIDKKKYSSLEIFNRCSKEMILEMSKEDNSFAEEMKTATSSIRLIKFLEYNKEFIDKF